MYKTTIYARFGACDAICEKNCQALPEQYYEQLEDELIGYKDVPISAYFAHLDKRWCRMDTKTPKKMRKEFYESWDQIMHISKFGKHLRKEQIHLKSGNININNDAKTQFCVEQMIDSCIFDKPDIIE